MLTLFHEYGFNVSFGKKAAVGLNLKGPAPPKTSENVDYNKNEDSTFVTVLYFTMQMPQPA